MMNNSIINQEETVINLLSQEHYFLSLLQALHSNNLLSTTDIEVIQLQLSDILMDTVGYYTKNKSCSVRVEAAEQLMLSICFTIGLFLKEQPRIKETISILKEKKLRSLFSEGQKILELKVEEGKKLLKLTESSKLKTENYAYIDTIEYGIPLFFKQYDVRFASHDCPGSIDYPLSIDVEHLAGVEYIEDYLKKVIVENNFCSRFDINEIEALLKGFNRNSHHMLINIFQLVLTNCLGRVIIGKEARHLDITKADRMYIKSSLDKLPEKEVEKKLYAAAEKLCRELIIEDSFFVEYIDKTVALIVPQIKISIMTDTLEKIFITTAKGEKNTVKYEDGEGVSNSNFRSITEEIRTCSIAEEKIKIIRKEFHSLKDLVDVLGADCIFGDEFIEIFKSLDSFEIALLIKSASNIENVDKEYGTESEKEWHEKLELYFQSLDSVRKEDIITIIEGIEL